jgi:hypothetical protein
MKNPVPVRIDPDLKFIMERVAKERKTSLMHVSRVMAKNMQPLLIDLFREEDD